MPVATTKGKAYGTALDHTCVDYPITFYIASNAQNSGSLIVPRIIAASSVYYGQGHPLNRTEILYPESEGYMPDDSITGPRMSIITRRSLLRGLLQALVSVKDIYRVGRASTCLHICVSSRYLDLVWNEWLPDWEENGWPTKDDEADRIQKDRAKANNIEYPSITTRNKKGRDRAASRASTRMSIKSSSSNASALSGMSGDVSLIYEDDSNRLINEDLLRKIAIFRRNYFINTPSNVKGSAYIQLLHYRQNPADRLAKEAVSAASLDLTTQVPRSRSMGMSTNGSIFSATSETDSLRPMSNSTGDNKNSNGRIRQGSITSSKSTKTPIKKSASILPSITMAAPAESPLESPDIAEKEATLVLSTPNTTKAAPAISQSQLLSTPASTVMITKRPTSRERNLSSYAISEGGTETDMEDFNDAVSTFSESAPPQGTLAKVASLPTAAVAATVAAVLGPAQEVSLLDSIAPKDDIASSNKDELATRETDEVLDKFKTPAKKEDIVSSTSDSRKEIRKKRQSKSSRSNGIEKTPIVAERTSSVARASSSSKKRNSISKTGESDLERQRSIDASTRSSAGVGTGGASGMKRDASQRSTGKSRGMAAAAATPSTARKESIARQDKVIEPPPKAKQRNSFFSFGKKDKPEAVIQKPKSTSKATYKPPMDRLIDYRPPQGRNLSSKPSVRQGDEGNQKLNSSATSPSVEDTPPAQFKNKIGASQEKKDAPKAATMTGRSGPFSFFKKRGSVKEVFAEA